MKPADIRKEIARSKLEVAQLLRWIEACEYALAAGLTYPRITRTERAMQLSSVTKRAASRSTRDHRGQQLLYKQNVTLAALAKELGESYPRVSKWFGPPDDNRPIPRRHAEYARIKYKIPLSVWARIGD